MKKITLFAFSLIFAFGTSFAPILPVWAASTGITLSTSSLTAAVNEQANFVVTASTDDNTTTDDTYITVNDGSAGGSFYTGTEGGACNSSNIDSDNKFVINQNKGVCYANSTPGTYTLTVGLYDSSDDQIGSDQTLSFTVEAPATSAPVIGTTTPVDGETIYKTDGTYIISAEVTDADGDLDTVTWSLTGAANKNSSPSTFTNTSGDTWSGTYNLTSIPVGAYTLEFTATDAEENSDTKTITGINLEAAAAPDPACTAQYDSASTTTDIQNMNSGDYFDSINDALADCDTSDGDTIELLGDITTSEQQNLDREITLDGNGHTIDAAFSKSGNSNNSAIGVGSDNVTIKDITVEGTNGTDLHGINAYRSKDVVVQNITAKNFRTGLLVNGSEVDASDVTTSGNTWHGINVDKGDATYPATLTIHNTSHHDESVQIYIDDISTNSQVTDADNQYDVQDISNFEDVDDGVQNPRTARLYTLKSESSVPACSSTDILSDTTFDTFSLGDVNGQNDWKSTGSYDQAVVDNTYGYTSFGCQSLRISNAVTTGGFGDQTFAAPIPDSVGDSDATAGTFTEGTRYDHFDIQFDIASTKPNQEQTGLALSVSPDRGDGSRMSYLSFADTSDGIDVTFYDTQGETDPANFVATDLGDLDRAVPHTIKFSMDMNDGPDNDVVKIYIDGTLVHTGGSWENYYRNDNEASAEQSPRLMKTLLIRSSGTAMPANTGEGFLFDNMSLEASNQAAPDTTAPSAPEITFPAPEQVFTTTPILNDWTDSTDDTGVDHYQIEYVYDDGHSFSGAPYRETIISERNHTPGISEQGGVTIRVRAFDAAGNSSEWSNSVHYIYDVNGTGGSQSDTTAPTNIASIYNEKNSGDIIPDGGITDEEYFTFNLTAEGDPVRWQLKYWNDIPGSSFNGESHAWSVNDLAPHSSALGVYNGHFTQGEGTHYFVFSACDADDNCSEFTDPFVVIYDTDPVSYPYGIITSPESDYDVVSGLTTLTATYDDNDANDTDAVQWAVRAGSCSSNIIFGNVDGKTDTASWDNENFSYSIDANTLEAGDYCFVFNPTDDAGENDVRETRWFTIQDLTSGGEGETEPDTSEGSEDGDQGGRVRSGGFSFSGSTTGTSPKVLGAETEFDADASCPAFSEYMREGDFDGDGDTQEVAELQGFLNTQLGTHLNLDGRYGSRTSAAVKIFQQLYAAEILSPWGLNEGTGWFYKTTRIKANDIMGCYDEAVLGKTGEVYSL